MSEPTDAEKQQWGEETDAYYANVRLMKAVELQASVACAWMFALGQQSPYRYWNWQDVPCDCEEGSLCHICSVDNVHDILLGRFNDGNS